jgi:hypothetical protein
MEKITLQNTPLPSLKRSMRDLFLDLVDITIDDSGKGCIKSVPTNYGYISFWYGWLDRKKLNKIYSEYVPKEKVKELKKNKKQDASLKLQDQISDFLFSIVRDHPEVIGEGFAEVHLTALTPRMKHKTLVEAASSLKEYALRLEKVSSFIRKNLKKKSGKIIEEIEANFESIDFITEKEVAKYADEYFWDDECGYVELAHHRLGCEMQIRINFVGDEKLEEVIDRIDEVISPVNFDQLLQPDG